MSDLINNREHRQRVLKELIGQLHDGAGVEQVKARFLETFQGVSASEISEVEQALILEGMPVSEVQRLCDVHAAVFKGSIEEIHRPQDPSEEPGHPVQTFRMENRELERVIDTLIRPNLDAYAVCGDAGAGEALERGFSLLWQVDRHYLRKENLLFPFLEKYSITAPPKVMWGVDDEIRALIRQTQAALAAGDRAAFGPLAQDTLNRVTEMIFKEENILLPMSLEKLTGDEWRSIHEQSPEIGFCLLREAPEWNPAESRGEKAVPDEAAAPGALVLPSGVLTLREIVRLLDTLPFDVTFVDRDDTVKYFSQGADRIFPRTKAVVGRKIANCHPPASVHIVEKILQDFKSGKKDHEDFWIKMGPRFVLIRYFSVRDEGGQYMGTLEVTQDIAPIRAIEGEKRLLSE